MGLCIRRCSPYAMSVSREYVCVAVKLYWYCYRMWYTGI
jgi:hypothetical protein